MRSRGRAVLDDAARVEHEHPVGDLHRREPVGDDHRGAVGEQRPQRVLHEPLRRDVERRRRLVEDQHGGIGEERAGERDELALAGREPRALLVDVGVVAVGQRGDELVRADRARRALRSRARGAPGRPSAMLSATDPVKRKFSWVTVTTARRRSASVEVAQVDAVEQHAAVGRVPEARREPGDRRLARAGRADDRDRLAGRDRRGRGRCSTGALAVRELDAVEAQRAVRRARAAIGLRPARGTLGGSSSTPDSFSSAGGRGLEQVVELAQLLHRLEEPPQVQQERGEHADAHLAVDREPAAVEHHDRGRHAADELHARSVGGGEPLRPDVGARGSGRRGARRSPGCAARAGTRARPGCRRGSRRSARSPARSRRASRGRRARTGCGTSASCTNRIGNDAEHRERERAGPAAAARPPMPTIEQHRRDEGDEAVPEHVGDRLDVGGLARDDAARRVALVERDAQPLEVQEDAAPEVEDRRPGRRGRRSAGRR